MQINNGMNALNVSALFKPRKCKENVKKYIE